MSDIDQPPPRTWVQKFRDSGRGLFVAIRGDASFAVHLFAAGSGLALAATLPVTRAESCILILCIALVITAELVNTSLERLAKAVAHEFDPHVRDALDISSGAVLAASIGAAAIGCLILLPHVLAWLRA